MLGLFKDQEIELAQGEGLKIARNLLISSLNKGIIPNWEYFYNELPVLGDASELETIKEYFQSLILWPFLEQVLDFDATEYFFHAPKHAQRLLHSGAKESLELPILEEDWQLWLEIISVHFKQNWNVENPFASFYGELCGKKYRLSLIHGSTSPQNKSKLILRSISSMPHSLETFGDSELLPELVKNKNNLLIAGSTGSGKTSLLSTLLSIINQEEHLMILEDTYEIISEHPHTSRFLAGDTPQTSLKAYLSYCLRMSPDRIILGEMRSHEVVPFMMAMNTGHKGLMGTLHASNAHDALHRVALLFTLYSGEASLSFEKVMELLCRNLEYVVFMENKKVKEVIKILGTDKGVAFYETVVGEGNPIFS